MTGIELGFLSIAAILILIYAGMHIAVALLLLSFASAWAITGRFEVSANLLGLAVGETIGDYVFSVVPLFVLMGLLVSVADLGRDAFQVAHQLLRRVRGGLGIATVAANAVFAAITGVSIASAAVFTKVAVPEMLALGYRPRFAVGVVAGSSVLGMLIPPSLLLIIFGVLSEQSIGHLFIAGIVPGIILSVAFSLGILAMAHAWPGYVGLTREAHARGAGGRLGPAAMAAKLLPVVLLVAAVLGGMYGGFVTPTEAAAVGASGALLLALAKRRLTARSLWTLLAETGHVTVSILILIIAANIYTRMLALAGIPSLLGAWVGQSGLGFHGVLFVYVVLIVLLGTILDSVSIMLIVVPLVLPIATAHGANLIWFGIVTVLAVEIGLLTPPFGLSVYVIKSTLDDQRISLGDVFAGSLPFVVIMIAVLGLLIAFPRLSLVLL